MTHEECFEKAAEQARLATCRRAKCGSIVVLGGEVVGTGYNSPAGNAEHMCDLEFGQSPKPKSDRTCCMHAEWRAILAAVATGKKLAGGTLYFTRVDDSGQILRSGEPYCTVCSRFALDVGLAHFALWHDDGIKLYPTDEYNRLSYQFHMPD